MFVSEKIISKFNTSFSFLIAELKMLLYVSVIGRYIDR